MVERYSITAEASLISTRFHVEVPDFYRPHFNASPTQLLPVITAGGGSKGLSNFYWGTSPEWLKNKAPSEKMINTRAELFGEKPALKRALMKTRCLIVADGFYAWRKIGKKTSIPYRVMLQDGSMFACAGMWEEFEDTDGNEIQTFSLITSPASVTTATVSERMPVILQKDSEQMWLDLSTSEEYVMEALSNGVSDLQFYPVSPAIANTERDLPSMILPAPPADQHGNLTLFD